MVRVLLILVALLIVAPFVRAADGSNCSIDTHYTPGTSVCILLADGRVETGASTADSAPFDTQPASTAAGSHAAVFGFGQCPTSCEPGTAALYESDSAVVGVPNVWHKIAEITGCGATFVSEFEPLRVSKRWVKTVWAADITDADCTAPGVDLTLTFVK